MTSKTLLVLVLTVLTQKNCAYGSAILKNQNGQNSTFGIGVTPERRFFGENEERSLEQEIFQELNHLSARKQREIFHDLEKQREELNSTQKSLVLSDPESLSPLNVEELKNIRKTIQTNNSSLPPIRNKRTLNLLLSLVARAMGYTLTPSNPDAEWIPRQRPQQPPCPTTPPPCTPSTPAPPCAMPTPAPPCRGSTAMQPATLPSNQIDANTISYPFRPARTIPLLNFAPLPQGIRVPYPPLFQPPAQRSPCAPSPPPPCGTTPAPPPPPCGATPAPSPPPCGTTPAPSPPPCGTTPAPSPPPCKTTSAPPPCSTPPPPCSTPAPKPPPCATPAPSPPPCATPAPSPPPCATPAPNPPPCGATPAPKTPPCGAAPPPPPPPPPAKPKGSILLEYDDPVRIQIFSNEKKYLPASGNIFSGHNDGYEERTFDHSYFFPSHEELRKKDEDVEEEEEQEHLEAEEEEEEEPRKQDENLRYREEEDERAANNEEDESEIKPVVKKPNGENSKRRRLVSTKTSSSNNKKVNDDGTEEKTPKMKKPNRKKWVRIVKKQRRKTKTDSSPVENYHIYSSDNVQDGSSVTQRVFGRSAPDHSFLAFDTYSKFDTSVGPANTNPTHVELKKVIVNGREVSPSQIVTDVRGHDVSLKHLYPPEVEDERRKKLEQAVERYVEDYVEKQLGDELLKNTGVPKTTIFNFEPKEGPRIQTITRTVAKSTRNGVPVSFSPQFRPETKVRFGAPQVESNAGNARLVQRNSYEENVKKKGNVSYEAFATRS